MKTCDNRRNIRFLLTPKLDIVFKLLFTSDTELLIDLINSVLNLTGDRRIRSVEVKNPTVLPEEITKKFIILDIRAVDGRQNQYDIEIQVTKYEAYPKRTLYYASRLYADQLGTGEDYAALNPVIGIHFLDYDLFPGCSDFHFHFYLRDIRYPELCLTDDLSLHIFELPKVVKLHDSLSEWLYFFNHAHEEDKAMRTHYKNPAIHRAFGMLEKLSADKQFRRQAEIREKALRNEVSMLAAAKREGIGIGIEKGIGIGVEKGIGIGMDKGIEIGVEKGIGIGMDKGIEKEKKQTAFNMLTEGIDIKLITRITGLSEDEIRQLRENSGTTQRT